MALCEATLEGFVAAGWVYASQLLPYVYGASQTSLWQGRLVVSGLWTLCLTPKGSDAFEGTHTVGWRIKDNRWGVGAVKDRGHGQECCSRCRAGDPRGEYPLVRGRSEAVVPTQADLGRGMHAVGGIGASLVKDL